MSWRYAPRVPLGGLPALCLAATGPVVLPAPVPARAAAAGPVCALACDALDPSKARQDTFPVPDRTVDGRILRLHASDPDSMAWASIDDGTAGDSVRPDRSWDRGATWEGLLGRASVPARGPAPAPSCTTESRDTGTASCDDNQKQFKGVFVRHLADLADATGSTAYRAFTGKQADSIWTTGREALNRLGQRWAGTTPGTGPGTSDWRTQASALEALTAAPRVAPRRRRRRASPVTGRGAGRGSTGHPVTGSRGHVRRFVGGTICRRGARVHRSWC